VVLFHAVEEKDGEDTKLRLMVEGQTKNNVWQPMDLGGFMEMRNENRTIGFSNCERYYAKGTRGIKGVLQIPELTETSPNDFLTRLFEQYGEKSAVEIEALNKQKKAYEAAMAKGKKLIDGIVDADTATTAITTFKDITHALTSKAELQKAVGDRVKELGLVYDSEAKAYKQGETA
jgi:hypothetical protein